THRPDLFRFPELIAVLTLVVLLVGVMRGALVWRYERVLFIAALAITTIGVFNQQILTGRSLQPFHYEWFIGNYCAGLALILSVWLGSSSRKRVWIANKRLLVVSILALLWAVSEVWLAASLTRPYNDQIDDGRAVAARLRELSFMDGTSAAARNADAFPVVLAADLKLADLFRLMLHRPCYGRHICWYFLASVKMRIERDFLSSSTTWDLTRQRCARSWSAAIGPFMRVYSRITD